MALNLLEQSQYQYQSHNELAHQASPLLKEFPILPDPPGVLSGLLPPPWLVPPPVSPLDLSPDITQIFPSGLSSLLPSASDSALSCPYLSSASALSPRHLAHQWPSTDSAFTQGLPPDFCPPTGIYSHGQTLFDPLWTAPLAGLDCSAETISSIAAPSLGLYGGLIDLGFLTEQEQFLVDQRMAKTRWKEIQKKFRLRWKPITVQGLVMRLRRLREKYDVIGQIIPAKPHGGRKRRQSHGNPLGPLE